MHTKLEKKLRQIQNPKTKIKTRLHQSKFTHKRTFVKPWCLELPF